jgi:hypothetical protein
MGEIYEVGTSLASYLLAIDAAEPVSDTEAPDAFPIMRHEVLDDVTRRLCSEGEESARAGHRVRRSNKRGKPQTI